uniref:Peptidase A1 domain-containing protein n=1 Tax=Oryza brachyantha TaxID=4533 RepID=J3LZX4_ORYBR
MKKLFCFCGGTGRAARRPERASMADWHYLVIPIEHIPTVNDLRRNTEDHQLVSHMVAVGRDLLNRDAPNSEEHRFGFHQPPFNSVDHLHLHCLALPFMPRFSYCLVAHSFCADRLIRPSPLILGRSPDAAAIGAPGETDFVYTPLLHNPKHPYFYSVALEAVSVGGKRIQAQPELGYVDRDGNGGMVVDSGTTFTMLPSDTFARVADEFARAMAAARFTRAEDAEAQTGLSPCYHYSPTDRAVPPVALHFRGNATVALPRRNYFMGFKSKEGRAVGCLMLMNVVGNDDDDDDDGGGPAGTLGNFQQQGFEVVYDVDASRVGFAPRRGGGPCGTRSRAGELVRAYVDRVQLWFNVASLSQLPGVQSTDQ